MNITEELEKLCSLRGISGDESEVADYIVSRVTPKCESVTVDPLGNVLAFKKGKRPAAHKVLVSAHMDEVGLIVTYICGDGSLKFAAVGGIDPRVLFGRRVRVGKSGLLGVIGGKAVHNLTDDERAEAPQIKDMTIDIGCASAEQAAKLVSVGDGVTFESRFMIFGNNDDRMIKARAIDDRAGCAVMLSMIDGELPYDTYFSFVVQEEVGLRGSRAAAYTLEPDFAVVLEATTAADIPSSGGEKRVCKVGGGPVISFIDRHTIYDKELYKLAFDTAKSLSIPCQTKTMVAGGNDAGAIHVSRGGVRCAAVSVPCRYLHSPSCVISERDLAYTLSLAENFCERIHEL